MLAARGARPTARRPTPSAPPRSRRAFDELEKEIIRHRIAVDKKRPDGRAQDEIRPIECEIDVSPRVHGSALFTRGETQILSNVALGTTRMDMKVDNLSLQETKSFWHHYNFPPFSVGEAGFMRGPKRRDIGHGALAERALAPTIPSEEDFPYVVRVVSDTLESNGSSSMGSVCASSMALMAAGVPVSTPVAGVAMGLIKEGDDHVVLTDIAGVEDHLGDMDFKVAGSEDGITALQMDIKISGVTFEILTRRARAGPPGHGCSSSARWARRSTGRARSSRSTRRAIEQIKIDPEKIGAVIGKGGETIRGMQEEFEAEIDVDDDGTVRVYAPSGALVEACIARIESMTKEAEVGDRFTGKVVKTTTFGAFVELTKGTDGLLHISNVKPGERVERGRGRAHAGDELDVTVVEVDRERGRIGLRLSDDPAVEGKTPGGADQGRHRRPAWAAAAAGGRPRAAGGATASASTAAGGAEAATGGDRPSSADRHGSGLRAGGVRPPRRASSSPRSTAGFGSITEAVPSVRSVALGLWVRTGLARRDAGAGRRLALPRAPAVQGHRAPLGDRDLGAVRRHGRGHQRGDQQGVDAPARAPPRRAHRGGLRASWPRCCSRPRCPRTRSTPSARWCSRRSRCTRTSPRTASTTCSPRRSTATTRSGRRVLGERRGDRLDPGARDRRLPPASLHGPQPRRRGGRTPRARPRSSSSPSACLAAGARRTARRRRTAAEPERAALRFHAKDTEQYHICFGGPGISRGDERRFALGVLDAIFGGSTSSRLFREVREKRGPRLRGRLLHRAVRRPRHGRDVRRHPRGERRARPARSSAASWRACATRASSHEELERAKEHVKGRMVLGLEATGARMTRLARAILFDVPLLSLDEMLERVDAVRRRTRSRSWRASSTTPSGSPPPASAPTRSGSARPRARSARRSRRAT